MTNEWQSLTHRFAMRGHKGYVTVATLHGMHAAVRATGPAVFEQAVDLARVRVVEVGVPAHRGATKG